MTFNRAIVVGASRGIGKELVRQLAGNGCKVVAIARNEADLENLHNEFPHEIYGLQHDVTHFAEAESKFLEACQLLGGLDLFIYNAGVMPVVEDNEFSFEKDSQMIDVNISGAVCWCNMAAQRFAGTGGGTLCGIGSVAGERGRFLQPVYNASKAFLHCYLESLRNRLWRKGVKVVTVKPGPVDTEMTQHLEIGNKISAKLAATKILKKCSRDKEHFLSPVHAVIFCVIKHVPSAIFKRLKI